MLRVILESFVIYSYSRRHCLGAVLFLFDYMYRVIYHDIYDISYAHLFRQFLALQTTCARLSASPTLIYADTPKHISAHLPNSELISFRAYSFISLPTILCNAAIIISIILTIILNVLLF